MKKRVFLFFAAIFLMAGCNGGGGGSGSGTATLTVSVNDPVAQLHSLPAPMALAIDFLFENAHAAIPAGVASLIVTVTNASSATVASGDVVAAGGALTLTVPAGVPLTITANAYNATSRLVYSGTTNVASITAGQSVSVPVSLASVNYAPLAVNSTINANDSGGTGTLQANDGDGDTLTYSVVSQGNIGTVTITNTATGAFTYTPKYAASGTDSFTFKANDGTIDSNTATVTVNVSTAYVFPYVVSADSAGNEGDDVSQKPATSSNGLYVAFQSLSTNLVAGDTNGAEDIFYRDIANGTTTRINLDSTGNQAGGATSSTDAAMSADGRYVSFTSTATLVAGDTNGVADVFLRDTQTGTTTRVSVATGGTQSNAASYLSAISGDGRYVAFESSATNLVAGDTNNMRDIFLHDTQTGTTTRVSVDSAGNQGTQSSVEIGSRAPDISSDGRYITFYSDALGLVVGDTNNGNDIFRHDTQTGQTIRVSVDSAGNEVSSGSIDPAISSDGRYIAFFSTAANLVTGDANGAGDVFLHDIQTGLTTRVSVDSAGNEVNGRSDTPSISSDGRYVAFDSAATNLVTGDTNGVNDVFVHDTQTGTTIRASLDSSGNQGTGVSEIAILSGDARFVYFDTAYGFDPADTNGEDDVYIQRNSLVP